MPLNHHVRRCTATTRAGRPCPNPARRGELFCRMHVGASAGSGQCPVNPLDREATDVVRRATLESSIPFDENVFIEARLVETPVSPAVGLPPHCVSAPADQAARPVAPVGADSPIDVILAAGPVLRVRPGFDAETLRRLVDILAARQC